MFSRTLCRLPRNFRAGGDRRRGNLLHPRLSRETQSFCMLDLRRCDTRSEGWIISASLCRKGYVSALRTRVHRQSFSGVILSQFSLKISHLSLAMAHRTPSEIAATVAGTRFPPSHCASFRAARIAAIIPMTRFLPSSIDSILHRSPLVRHRNMLLFFWRPA